jgi:5-methylcytosine-specific restriction endonuclease McrA
MPVTSSHVVITAFARAAAPTRNANGSAYVRLCTWGERGRWFSVRHHPRIAKLAQQKYGVPRARLYSEWWDMDHLVPVIEGGGGCGLDNLRTLCIPCHRAETRALAARRAAARRSSVTESGKER